MKRWLQICIGLTAAALAGSLYFYFVAFDTLPEQLTIHWNLAGEADGWIAKDDALGALLIGPAVMGVMTLLALAFPWLSPRNFDVERFRPTYEYLMVLVVALMGYIHAALLLSFVCQDFDAVRLLISGIFVFFALMGNVMGKVRRNFWMGVRTPWTLASETVWVRTHRVAAWLWMPSGLLGAAAILLGAPLEWCFVFLMVVAIAPAIYSLALYKRLEKEGRLSDAV